MRALQQVPDKWHNNRVGSQIILDILQPLAHNVVTANANRLISSVEVVLVYTASCVVNFGIFQTDCSISIKHGERFDNALKCFLTKPRYILGGIIDTHF
jgi:hypothetical protein